MGSSAAGGACGVSAAPRLSALRRALSRTTLPVLLKGDLDAAKAQMVAAALRLSCATAKNDALPHGRLVVEHRVDWRLVLHGDETSPGRIEKHAISPFGVVNKCLPLKTSRGSGPRSRLPRRAVRPGADFNQRIVKLSSSD